jgi:hypothetical protein
MFDFTRPPEVEIYLTKDRRIFTPGDLIEDSVHVHSEEDFLAQEISCELECVNMHVVGNDQSVNLRGGFAIGALEISKTLYYRKSRLGGPLRITKGYSGDFPFIFSIPPYGDTTYGNIGRQEINSLSWVIRCVIAVGGRPDVKKEFLLKVVPPENTQKGQSR